MRPRPNLTRFGCTGGTRLAPKLIFLKIYIGSELVVRGGIEPPTFRFSGGRSYRLSYLTSNRHPRYRLPGWPPCPVTGAVLTGFEPATSTLTGWRALRAALQDHVLQLLNRYLNNRAPHLMRCPRLLPTFVGRTPNGIRTRAAALKGRCPRPLDDGGSTATAALPLAPAVGDRFSIGDGRHRRQSGCRQPAPPCAALRRPPPRSSLVRPRAWRRISSAWSC